jgi:glycosyltransferase involved in cell wall biosynthesis
MDELARRFHADRNDVEFVSWVSDVNAIARIDFERFQSEGGVHYSDPVRHTPRPVRFARQMSARLARTEVFPLLSGQFARVAGRLSRMHKGGVTPLKLEAGDVLVIGWGEWWDPNFIRLVVDAAQRGVKIVQFVYDLGPVTRPHLAGNSSSFVDYFATVLPRATLLVSISEHTRRELVEWGAELGFGELPVTVIRLGDVFTAVAPVQPAPPAVGDELGRSAFVLCVGTIEAKKNHALLYYVYKQAARRKISLPRMVVVGRRGWRTDDIYGLLTEDPELADRFVFFHDASDAELVWLYENCRYTVLPSFFEGWGIPVAESVSRGVPCLCSSAASIPEIAPGAVRHFHPDAPEELLGLMEELNDDEALERARHEAAAYVPTTWDQTFEQVTGALDQL